METKVIRISKLLTKLKGSSHPKAQIPLNTLYFCYTKKFAICIMEQALGVVIQM
jgi:hypothetical protein